MGGGERREREEGVGWGVCGEYVYRVPRIFCGDEVCVGGGGGGCGGEGGGGGGGVGGGGGGGGVLGSNQCPPPIPQKR